MEYLGYVIVVKSCLPSTYDQITPSDLFFHNNFRSLCEVGIADEWQTYQEEEDND